MLLSMPVKSFLFLLFLVLSLPLAADQSDPRLEELFKRLKTEEDVYQANAIANTIWGIWTQNDDAQANALMQRGIQQISANSLVAARDTFTRLIKQKPEFAEAWNKRATVYYLLGEYDASLRDIDEVLKREPFHFGAISGRGLVYIAREDYFRARTAFLNLLEIYPAMPGVKDNIRQLEQVLKDSVI